MKRKYLILLVSVLLMAASCGGGVEPLQPQPHEDPQEEKPVKPELKPAPGATVYGIVRCGDKGIGGVAVSDGFEVVVTDQDGVYQLPSRKRHGYVFISVPSGYEVASRGVLPQFFRYLSEPAKEAERADFELYEVDQSEYTMLFFGDMHLADRRFCNDIGQFRDFADDVEGFLAGNGGRRTYAMTLGDMSWDYFWAANSYGLTQYVTEVGRSLGGLQIFHTMGNHDNDPSRSGDFDAEITYKMEIGPTYYSFNVGQVHYIVLDDVDYRNSAGNRDFYRQVTGEQQIWLVRDLENVSPHTPVFVTMHCPLYARDGSMYLSGAWDLIKRFDGFDHVQFVTGHTHVVYNVDCLDRSVHVYENNSGAVCGAWWMTSLNYEGLHIGTDGAPGGYRVLQVEGKELDWRYKGAGLDDDYQFRTYDRNSICLSPDAYVPHAGSEGRKEFLAAVGDYSKRSTANQVLINIWDIDPSWKISVKENGRELSVRQMTDTKDPLYLVAYEAYELDNGWSISYPCSRTDHIYSVTASAPDTDLTITVTDRFGRVYTEQMKRPKAFTPGVYASEGK